MSGPRAARSRDHERTIGRLLKVMTYVAVGLLLVGFLAMIIAGISPIDAWPALDPGALPAQLVAATPVAFLWLGLLAVIATPIVRVIAAGVAYGSGGEWRMVAISIAILAVIIVGVASAVGTEA